MANDAMRKRGAGLIQLGIGHWAFTCGHWALGIGHSLLLLLLLVAPRASAASRFDDVSISTAPLTTGDTQHGYLEHRITVQNDSPTKSHKITIILPDKAYGGAWGEGLRSLSRTVAVGPNSTATVSLWQPALPIWGDGNLRVLIDGRERGTLPSAHNRHGTGSGGGGRGRHSGSPDENRTLLLSRTLNSDDLDRQFKTTSGVSPTGRRPYSPEMATGAPDTRSTKGLHSSAWYPERHKSGTEWLELEYATPMAANQLRLLLTDDEVPGMEAVLLEASGATLATVKATNAAVFVAPLWVWTVDFPATTNAVAKVRLNFNTAAKTRPLGMDAVELVGPSARAWASRATASSFFGSGSYVGSGSAAARLPKILRAESEVTGWSEQWLAYTPFDAVIVKDADITAMPGAVRDALWRYVECGGSLVVLGKVELSAPWGTSWETLPLPTRSGHSTVTAPRNGSARNFVGFGQVLALDAPDTDKLQASQLRELGDSVRAAAQPWVGLRNGPAANSAFPVVDDLRIPVRGLVFLMLVFVLGIGPVNLYVLHRMQKKIWLLWTVPAISFGACALLFLYSLLSEGITPHVRTEGLTLLDQVNHRATTLGMTAIYAPLTPNAGLRFSYDTELTPMLSGGNAPRELDWSEGQHLARGWVTARVPAHFQLRKSETRRERLQLEKMPDGKIAAVNGLGATVEKLWVADQAGRISAAFSLAPGQKMPLTLTGGAVLGLAGSGIIGGGQRQAWFHGDWGNLTDFILKDPTSFLSPGTYIALLDDAPFIEKSLAGKAPVRARQIVYGFLEPPEVKP